MTCNCQNDGGKGIETFKQKVEGIGKFTERLENPEIDDLSFLLKDHLSFGNTKLPEKIAIFNLGSAKDCPNYRNSSCQAYDEDTDTDYCYARKAEKQYPDALEYRRRQQIIWNRISASEFSRAFEQFYSRMRKDISFLRFNESGDFRNQRDVHKAEQIAKYLKENLNIDTYTYTASDELDFTVCEYLTVNASNPDINGYDQRFTCVEDESDIPDNGFVCPQDCSVCHACMSDGGTSDIYELLH